MVTKEELLQRLRLLEQDKAKLAQQLQNMQRMSDACSGAINETQIWLNKLEEAAKAPTDKPAE